MGLFGGDSESEDYLNQALQQFQQLQTPTVASGTVSNLPQETVQGSVAPEAINAAQQGNTAFNNISLDPSTRQAEISALGGFSNIAGAGGLDANALLGINQARDSANATNAGMQGAITQNAAAMGEGNSANTLTQREIAAQGAANTNASAGLQEAAEAENNRQAALSAMANIGGNVNASDFNQAGATAQSQNAINASNTAATNAARTTNAANNLTGQLANTSAAQGVNAANTTANQGNAYYNAQLPQQQFNNNLAKAQGAAGVLGSQAGIAQQQSNQNAGMVGSLIGAAGTVGGAYAGAPVAKPLAKATPASSGGIVPGKARVPGDSKANDDVPILASPDELIIPRSVPKDGKHMEEFARNAPVAGNPNKRVNLVDFMKHKKAA